MDNIYYKIYKTAQKINENLSFDDFKSYIFINHPSKYYLWKESSINKQFKNLITDKFISDEVKDKPFLDNYYDYNIKYLASNIHIYDSLNNVIVSSDDLNTFTKTNFLYSVKFSDDNVYFQRKDNFNLCIGQSFDSFYETKIIPANTAVTCTNDLFCSFPAPQPAPDRWGRKPKILDPRVYYMGNMSGGFTDQKKQIKFSDGKESIGFSAFSYIDDNYIVNTNGIYKSTDRINFNLINSNLENVKIGKYFLSNGANASIYFSKDNKKVYLGLTKNFIDVTYIKELDTNTEVRTTSYYNYYNVFIFNDVIYFCTPSGVRYSKDLGETWEVYDIKNPISVTINKEERPLIYTMDGVYLI